MLWLKKQHYHHGKKKAQHLLFLVSWKKCFTLTFLRTHFPRTSPEALINLTLNLIITADLEAHQILPDR